MDDEILKTARLAYDNEEEAAKENSKPRRFPGRGSNLVQGVCGMVPGLMCYFSQVSSQASLQCSLRSPKAEAARAKAGSFLYCAHAVQGNRLLVAGDFKPKTKFSKPQTGGWRWRKRGWSW